MKLSFKLALLNIRRYPLRIFGSAVCLLLFGFALFSAVTFTRTLNNTVSNALKSRSSGNTVIVKNGVEELDYISKNPGTLETRAFYLSNYEYGQFEIEGVGEFDEINLFYEQAPDSKTLIPDIYLEEFCAVSNSDLLVAGRLPENSGEMMINEGWFKSSRITDYGDILNKKTTFYTEYFDGETKNFKTEVFLEDAKIVGVYSEDFLDITALSSYKYDSEKYGFAIAFLINPECKPKGVEAFCTIDKIDRVYADFCAKYGEENVIKTVLAIPAIEQLSGFNAFIGNLMYLAAAAIAFIYVMTRMVSALNYFKEKSSFLTATDAFGCSKRHIIGAFAAENITLLIPISIISAVLSCSFIKLIFRIISSYIGIGIEFDTAIDFSSIFTALVLMLIFEILILLISFLLFRNRSND